MEVYNGTQGDLYGLLKTEGRREEHGEADVRLQQAARSDEGARGNAGDTGKKDEDLRRDSVEPYDARNRLHDGPGGQYHRGAGSGSDASD